MHAICKLTAPGLVCVSLVGMGGCATTAELESLRAEIAKANSIAARAAVNAEKARSELAELKAVTATAVLPDTPHEQEMLPPEPAGKSPGYKWGLKDSDFHMQDLH